MNRAAFFASLRQRTSGVFGTSLNQSQVQGVEAILDEAQRRGTPLPHLAYMLSTAYHETGAKMVPNTENLNYTSAARIRQVWPSRFPTEASAAPYVRNPRGLANKVYNGRMGNRDGSDDGWLFRGRGLPHLTGRDNYQRASNKVGVDLIRQPDLALELPIAVKVLFDGMGEGWFTGQRLSTRPRPIMSARAASSTS
jgi:putative chitinase